MTIDSRVNTVKRGDICFVDRSHLLTGASPISPIDSENATSGVSPRNLLVVTLCIQ